MVMGLMDRLVQDIGAIIDQNQAEYRSMGNRSKDGTIKADALKLEPSDETDCGCFDFKLNWDS